jgi:cholera toxin transcriptional activator
VPAPLPSPIQKTGLAIARFGVFEADLQARELRKQGRRLRLQDQPFSLLALLLERGGKIVTREELREKLWPADTFVDFDHSLNTAVNKVREALGDSASNPRFVETLARRGYRFLGPVQWENPQAPDGATAALETPSQPATELPAPHRGISRSLFGLIQLMYLVFYLEGLFHLQGVGRISELYTRTSLVLIVVLITAAAGIPVRLYLLSAVAFDYALLGEKFRKLFVPLLALDQLWAIAPFLLLEQIGIGAALAATAALVYAPFAERTLVRMAYRTLSKSP